MASYSLFVQQFLLHVPFNDGCSLGLFYCFDDIVTQWLCPIFGRLVCLACLYGFDNGYQVGGNGFFGHHGISASLQYSLVRARFIMGAEKNQFQIRTERPQPAHETQTIIPGKGKINDGHVRLESHCCLL